MKEVDTGQWVRYWMKVGLFFDFTENNGKSVIAKRFIEMLRNKIYK